MLSPTDPNLTVAMAALRSTMPKMKPSEPQALPSGPVLDGHNAIYLSILNERRRRSMTYLNSARAGVAPDTASSTAAVIPSQNASQPIANVSAADYDAMMASKFDSTVTAPSRRRKPNFAEKLHAVLDNQACRHAITWLPSGRSFCITDQKELVTKILPKYFREAKFESFSRKLKRWGFRKVYTTGLSQVIFSHDLFHRGRPDLCKIMNGREKAAASEDPRAAGAGTADLLVAPEQVRTAMLLEQARTQQQLQHQAAFQQQMNQHASMSMPMLTSAQGRTQSPARTASAPSIHSLNQSHSLRGHASSLPWTLYAHTQAVQANPSNSSTSMESTDMQMARLNHDIASCEQRLSILQRMKEI